MKITYVNNCDLEGRIFNGYDLHRTLNQAGHSCTQIVLSKKSGDETVTLPFRENMLYMHQRLVDLEDTLRIRDIVFPYAYFLKANPSFRGADIVHYHILHNNVIPVGDWGEILADKRAVWTVHDPWIMTGNCVHPLECEKWKTGCHLCTRVGLPGAEKSDQFWKLKRDALKDVNPHIVIASEWMACRLKESPLTAHFSQVHKIPFGIDLDRIAIYEKALAKEKLKIPKENLVIGFRNQSGEIKGVKYIREALQSFRRKDITLLAVDGYGVSLKTEEERFQCVELGWQNDPYMMDLFYCAADIFLMPSLAESFGMMAVEAMAHECPVVCFTGTVLEEITRAPECGVAVRYRDADALRNAVEHLAAHPEERRYRGEIGRKIVKKDYRYSDYVNRHLELYGSIIEENAKEGQRML